MSFPVDRSAGGILTKLHYVCKAELLFKSIPDRCQYWPNRPQANLNNGIKNKMVMFKCLKIGIKEI